MTRNIVNFPHLLQEYIADLYAPFVILINWLLWRGYFGSWRGGEEAFSEGSTVLWSSFV